MSNVTLLPLAPPKHFTPAVGLGSEPPRLPLDRFGATTPQLGTVRASLTLAAPSTEDATLRPARSPADRRQ